MPWTSSTPPTDARLARDRQRVLFSEGDLIARGEAAEEQADWKRSAFHPATGVLDTKAQIPLSTTTTTKRPLADSNRRLLPPAAELPEAAERVESSAPTVTFAAMKLAETLASSTSRVYGCA